MLFAGWEIRIVKNCDRGLENAGLGQHFQVRGKKTHASVTVTVVRDRKIRTALKTNQIVGFVTLAAWKKQSKILRGNRLSSAPARNDSKEAIGLALLFIG